jgi:anti-sigma B factor antagonist
MSDTIFELDGNTLTVKPVGELDSVTSPAFEAELNEHLQGIKYLIADFEQVTYISSAGLRVLLAAEQSLEEKDGEIKIIHVNDHIMKIFELVGFLNIVTVE